MIFARTASALACTAVLASVSIAPLMAQMGGMEMKSDSKKPLASPTAHAAVSLAGKPVTIDYNSPRVKGRKIFGDLVPYGQVWRTGANPATTLKTATALKIGTLSVPAGTYTIYTLPTADSWQMIINKQTGQWGTEYTQAQDLGRTPLTGKSLPSSQENMSISFEHTSGPSTELHIRWDKTDEMVAVSAQ